MVYTAIRFERAGAVATLTLNRPDKLNCFTQTMIEEILDALGRVAALDSGVRCLVITGAGRGFCSGQDLGESIASPSGAVPDLGAIIDKSYSPMIRALRGLELPVVGAVNGVTAGAGVGLALACDIVLAARSAYFVLPFSRIGLAADGGATWTLPRLVGHARALALTLLGEQLSAERAEQWGLIWKMVEDAELMGTARDLAAQLATQATRALGYLKKLLQASTANSLDAQLDLERDIQRLAGRTEDFREGVAAFLAKRAPKFTGK